MDERMGLTAQKCSVAGLHQEVGAQGPKLALLLELQDKPLLHQHSAEFLGFKTKFLEVECPDIKLAHKIAHARVALLSAV